MDIAAQIAVVVIGILLVIQLIAITLLILAVKNLLTELREHIGPLTNKVNNLLIVIEETTEKISGKAERVAESAASASETVSAGVSVTAGLLQKIVTTPLIGGAAFSAGVRQGLATWRRKRAERHLPEEDRVSDD